MKTCTKCLRTLSEENFYKSTTLKCGRVSSCAQCMRDRPKIVRDSKRCPICKKNKQITLFGKNKGSRDGFGYACAPCVLEKNRQPQNKLKRRLYNLANRERANKRNAAFRKRHPGLASKYSQKHFKKYPERYRARYIVHNALRDGKLIRRPCEICKNEKSEAHHEDYTKPLVVKWLCKICHGSITYPRISTHATTPR